jgi:hypothetical protein
MDCDKNIYWNIYWVFNNNLPIKMNKNSLIFSFPYPSYHHLKRSHLTEPIFKTKLTIAKYFKYDFLNKARTFV